MSKKYYWLKLKEDFFDQKQIKFLRKLPDGDKLAIVYLKMQLKSLKTEGLINYDKILPSNIEELALILDEDSNVVALTVQALEKMELVEVMDDGSFFMIAMQELIGKESESAERVRRLRERQNQEKLLLGNDKALHSNADVTTCNATVTNCNTEIEKREKRKEKEKESIEATSDEVPPAPKKQKHIFGEYKKVKLTDDEFEKLKTDYGEQRTLQSIQYLDEYKAMKGKKYDSDYLALRKWVFKALDEKQPFMKNDVCTRGDNW